MSEVDMCMHNCGTPIPDGGTWGYCDNCWNYVCVRSDLEKKDVVSEVNIQTQLEVALDLLTKEQHDAWAKEMEIIQLKCSLMDAKRRIKELEERSNDC